MEPNLEKIVADAIQQYVSQALGQELPFWGALYLVVTAVVAATSAYFGSYLRKRAEQTAINENFKTALSQLREQTAATETIKHERDRIIHHLNASIESVSEVASISELCRRRTWTEGNDHAETQRRMLSQLSVLRLHAIVLRDFNAIEKSFCSEIITLLEIIRDHWDNVIGELSKKDPFFKQKFPDAIQYDGSLYIELGGGLLTQATALVELIGSMPRKIHYPMVDARV